MDKGTCSIADCNTPVKRAGYCYGHYMKAWRYGTPTPTHEPRRADLVGSRFGALVVESRADGGWICLCDCGQSAFVRTGDLNRGTTSSCGNRTVHYRRNDVGYGMAHERIRSDRGLVQTFACVDCGKQAQHWSYNHSDPDELLAEGLSSEPIAYSVKPEHYSARCVSCHKKFDLGRTNSTAIVPVFQSR